ncbi:3-hydroxyacyl-CoA dehydrogenase family protein [Gaopeijia maritima]|uniref:3-hydroxybutyryl-CoA dehydrogenase n=1 Tax=Gaopeijia maritima TaxID=3119007 RepID=A0ABU9E9Q1_9BACT
MKIERVGVVGCGLMGSGIAEVAARAGFEVMVRELDEAAIAAGRRRIERSMSRALEKEKVTAADNEAATARLQFTTELSDLADRDLVIEAIVENADAKAATFDALDAVCGDHAIFATNTSSLTVTDLAARTARPDRFVGLHFFNPVPVMRLVEVVPTLASDPDVVESVVAFGRALGKEPIVARDGSGFVVNLLLVPYMLDAVRQLERGVASIPDIDTAMRLGCGYPMGPFALADFVGLDTTLRIAEIMFDEYRESRYAPPPLLRRLVSLGRFGRKTGRGFYDYSGDEPVPLVL